MTRRGQQQRNMARRSQQKASASADAPKRRRPRGGGGGSAAAADAATAAAPTLCTPRRYQLLAGLAAEPGSAAVGGTCLTAAEVSAVAAAVGVADAGDGRAGAGGGGGSSSSRGGNSGRNSRRREGAGDGLLRRLHAALGTRPGEEWRWSAASSSSRPAATAAIRDPALRAAIGAAYRPPQPRAWRRKPRDWLGNDDLEAVMRQYAEAYPRFRFVGVFPRDFAARTLPLGRCVSPPMCALSARALLDAGQSEFGAIINLDTHRGDGSHWVAVYGCVARRPGRFGLWYYDSLGRPPLPEVAALHAALRAGVGSALGAPAARAFGLRHNPVRKQFQNTECGIYAMLFIVACLTTRLSFDAICTQLMRGDDETHRLRAVFYRPSDDPPPPAPPPARTAPG